MGDSGRGREGRRQRRQHSFPATDRVAGEVRSREPGSQTLAPWPGLNRTSKRSRRTASEKSNACRGWRSGRVRFENQTLMQVISEVNRYSRVKVLIEDSTIADLRISAVLNLDQVEMTGQVELLLSSLEDIHPIKVVRHPDRFVLIAEPDSDVTGLLNTAFSVEDVVIPARSTRTLVSRGAATHSQHSGRMHMIPNALNSLIGRLGSPSLAQSSCALFAFNSRERQGSRIRHRFPSYRPDPARDSGGRRGADRVRSGRRGGESNLRKSAAADRFNRQSKRRSTPPNWCTNSRRITSSS